MKIYCPEPLASHPLVQNFYFKYAPEKRMGGLFRENLSPNFFKHADFVEDRNEADVIVLPNNFLRLDEVATEYIARYASEAKVPVFVFSFGDLTHALRFDSRVRVLRFSTYRTLMTSNDIVVTTTVDDPSPHGIAIRTKTDAPTISFCGQASYATWAQWLRYYAKVAVYHIGALVYPAFLARVVGVYWRRRALRACRVSNDIHLDAIVRSSFSGAASTIELAPEEARKQFVENMRESDFVLAPKGDGNYSNRFVEALASGRIPVVIDTDMPLPLEADIDYTKICIRVPMSEVGKIPVYIRAFYDQLTPEEWEARQRLARDTFERYLRQDMCLEQVFGRVLAGSAS